MEAQVKGARPKQKNNTRKATAADTERKPSSGPSDAARRVIISAAHKRVIARFAKGPSDTGGFKYPRRRVSSSETLDLEPVVSLTEVMLTKEPATLEIIAVAVPLTEPVLASLEPVSGTLDQKHINDEETPATLLQEVVPVAENVPLEEMSKKVEEEPESTQESQPEPEILKETNQEAEVTKKVEFELPDDTVGPGDSRSSESESSSDEEESEVEETVTPIPVAAPAKIVKQATNTTKPTTSITMRKPVSPVYRKVVSAPAAVTTPAPRSSWSKFLPLVIEIKATIPYPMHLLGVFLLLVTGLLLRLLYQFGADLGGEMEVQGQFIRLAKLAFLFVVVAVCVNFVEDNKELQHKEPVLPAQPRLRPSKMSKNKKKMMLKV